MDIKTLNAMQPARQTDTSRKAEKPTEAQTRTMAQTQAMGEKVSINRLSAEAAAQTEKVGTMPEQSEKVQRLKQAISEGRYEVDTKAVAKKLMQTEALFSTL